MSHLKQVNKKIFTLNNLIAEVNEWKKSKQKIIFTNGCFDILHRGHIEVLAQAANLGGKVVVGLNSDTSIQKLKGKERPIVNEQYRAILLASLSFVDAVVVFDEDSPIKLIKEIQPDILVKGGDYEINKIIGRKIVQKNGGKVIIIPFLDNFSSTNIINQINKT